MDIFISADIEGCTGIASFSQCGRPDSRHFDYPFARRMMTHDVNAVIRGARRAGARRIVVKDGHATCKNLLLDELEPDVELISGLGATTDGMMDGIDQSFAAAMLVGYHGMAGAHRAMMDHALNSTLRRFWVNGREAGEILVNAAVAGSYKVPVVLVTSDEQGCNEARDAIPSVEAFATKQGWGRFMGDLLPPSVTSPGLEDAASRSMERMKEIPPVTLAEPVHMRLELRNMEEADLATTAESVARVDDCVLEWSRPSLLKAHRTALQVFQLSSAGRCSPL